MVAEDNAAVVEPVRAFLNTIEHAAGRPPQDRLGSPGELRRWLADHDLLDGPAAACPPATPADLQLAHRLRALLREVVRHGDGAGLAGAPRRRSRQHDRRPGVDAGAERRIDLVSTQLPLRVRLRAGEPPRLVPAVSGVRHGLARIMAAAVAIPLGDWERLKVCPADDCQWVFYDESRNRSRRWCSMEGCGNRSKVRSYRQRAR